MIVWAALLHYSLMSSFILNLITGINNNMKSANKNRSLKTQNSPNKSKVSLLPTFSNKKLHTISSVERPNFNRNLRYDASLFHKTIFHLKPLHDNPEMFLRQRSISSKALNALKQWRPRDPKVVLPHPIQMKLAQSDIPNRQKMLKDDTLNHITAKKWIIYSMQEKAIVKAYKHRYVHDIASISKLLTFYTVYEIIKEYYITIHNFELMATEADHRIGGTKIHLRDDDDSIITLEQALYALLMTSSNNIALVIANNLGSYHQKKKSNRYFNCFDLVSERRETNISYFVDLMNNNAKQLELTDSSFINPHGLSSNISSAYDVAKLASECFKIPLFCQISSTKQYLIRPKEINDNGQVVSRICILQNTNKLLSEGCLGGKTGSNKEGGDSFVGYFDGGIMIVVLGSAGRTQKFKDCMRLAEWVQYKLKLSQKHLI